MNTGFSTEEMPTGDVDTFISNVDISLLIEEPMRGPIQCFDVNQNGLIAVGREMKNGKMLCVYSSDGIFQYGYTFNCVGSFGVEWDGDNINIYFVRGDVIMSINRDGEILETAEVQNTIENNTYRNHMLFSTKRTT